MATRKVIWSSSEDWDDEFFAKTLLFKYAMFECKHFDKHFSDPDDLNNHVKRVHSFQCDECLC